VGEAGGAGMRNGIIGIVIVVVVVIIVLQFL